MISGTTQVIAHVGHPTFAFTAPLIYNPWFEHHDVDAVVVPMGVPAGAFDTTFPAVMAMTNVVGALVTMPHKVRVLDLVDDVGPAAAVAGAANAVRVDDGRLVADLFDGEGFVRAMARRGRSARGATALVVGCGGVGSAIAASLAGAGASAVGLFDPRADAMGALAERLRRHHPGLEVRTGGTDPRGYDVVVNATPLGMDPGDPLPLDPDLLTPGQLVGEVVLARVETPLLAAARARGCATQVGTDMLFEQIPAYLEFFGLGTATADELRRLARLP